AKIRKLAEHYEVPDDPQPAELLFAVHSYYAVFIKFLAAEIVSSFNPLGTSTLKKCANAHSSDALKREMEALEQGGIWSQLGITNFLEGDLFSWYLDAWNEHIAEVVWDIVKRLDDYDPSTLSVAPEESQDLLKQLYQQLFPKSVRHDLGEYYTPDWLAELVLDELEYDGNPDERLLDPACGSGTFLVTAINRIKAWFEEHRHECGYGEDELIQKILGNVVGFDLNPLAVMASRTNYLLAIRDLLRHADSVELPVYLCDSIMTPSEYGDLFTGGQLGTAQQLKTSAGEFHIPTEVTRSRDYIGRYADMLEFCIRNRYSAEEFLERCQAEGIPVTEERLHTDLYGQLQELDAENKNGVWARIIKNAFAPLFVGKADYIAGNPPWVNWESLPNEYRESTAPLWQQYDLFRHKGYKAKLGSGKDDVSILMTYVAHDAYLSEGGRLGFVITQSVFKTVGSGEGFRTFQYESDGETWYLKPEVVHDLSDFQPFEGATNRTAIIVVSKSKQPFAYPIPYIVWKKTARGRIASDLTLDAVNEATSRSRIAANPVSYKEQTSPWLTAPKEALPGIQKVIGQSDYKAYEGVNTGGLNGVYWIRVLEERPNGDLVIENLHDVGKIKVEHVETVIEPDLVYPLLRGRDVQRWHAEPSAHIILANRTDKLAGIPEAEMKRRWPKTFAYLKQFEGDPDNPQRGT
ncbi:MAG: N-6 DNA methylase, partial [Salinibacter sp.]